ncbi:MAG: NADH:flavin oxidoreductase/NADH oxidase family protein [Candidatus Schekmanbacteria bacterium]|nr:NADH:flavin oxidoreductase/NADH oxidase family protein [Candidatus Schekmanbacteria bacterium]
MGDPKSTLPELALDTPLALPNGAVIKNRLMKSAMSEQLADAEHRPTRRLAALYERWATGGVGLCITGNVMIDRRALGEPRNVVLEDDRELATFRAWADAAGSHGMQTWMQLNHPGKQIPLFLSRQPVAPSAVPLGAGLDRVFALPRALTDAEIREIIERFGRSAELAQRAGFTGVQIHGAHGYLVSQFLSPLHNRRDDDWGGSAENRRRFVLEVYKTMRSAVGNSYPVAIKLNSADFQHGGFTENDSLEVVRALAAAGIDLIEVSGGNYEAPAMTGHGVRPSTLAREAYFLDFAAQVRGAVAVPVGVTGGFRTAPGMLAAIRGGATDLVGLARPLAVYPDLPMRLMKDDLLRVDLPRPSTGVRFLDRILVLDITWFEHHLKRLAEGRSPRPRGGPWPVVWRMLTATGRQMLRRRRA